MTNSDLADIPARWSWLSHFASSALHARHAALYGKDPTAAMKLGTAGHVVTFEQPYAVWPSRRAGKAWEAFKAECAAEGKEPIVTKDYDKACQMRDALRSHPDAGPILFGDGVILEAPIHWVRQGRACSSRPDARKPGEWIADLKTCRTAHPEKFAKAAQWSGYYGQLAYYAEADAFECGRDPGSLASTMLPLYVVAVEPFAPFAITVFELDATAREFGQRSVAACWEKLTASELTNDWPGYSQSIVPLIVEHRGGKLPDFDEIDPPDMEPGDGDGADDDAQPEF